MTFTADITSTASAYWILLLSVKSLAPAETVTRDMVITRASTRERNFFMGFPPFRFSLSGVGFCKTGFPFTAPIYISWLAYPISEPGVSFDHIVL